MSLISDGYMEYRTEKMGDECNMLKRNVHCTVFVLNSDPEQFSVAFSG